MKLIGIKMKVVENPASLLWLPAPPKLSLHPTTIQSYLFPKYSSPRADKSADFKLPHKDKKTVERERIGRKRNLDPFFRSVPAFSTIKPYLTSKNSPRISTVNLTVTSTTSIDEADTKTESTEKKSSAGVTSSARVSSLLVLPSTEYHSETRTEVRLESGSDVSNKIHKIEYSQSMPLLLMDNEEQLLHGIANLDFKKIMEEVEKQRIQLLSYHYERKHSKPNPTILFTSDTDLTNMLDASDALSGTLSSRKLLRQTMKKKTRLSFFANKSRTLRRTRSAQMRTEKARELFFQPPCPLKRHLSHPLLTNELDAVTIQKPSTDYRRTRRLSEPAFNQLHFDALMHSYEQEHPDNHEDQYKWTYDLWWNVWFPEALKECRHEIAFLYHTPPRSLCPIGSCVVTGKCRYSLRRPSTSTSTTTDTKKLKKAPQNTKKVAASPGTRSTGEDFVEDKNQKVDLENIQPIDPTSAASIQSEINNLTESIYHCKDISMRAVSYCRRGAVLRKLGCLKDSLADLNQAIALQPSLSDAYWHRHILSLIQGDDIAAINDLSSLLKLNKHHHGAYCSKASLLIKSGNLSSAIYHLSQAISLNPIDPWIYFMRAELHERHGEIESALSDYAHVAELDLTSIEPLKRQAMHKFNKGMWGAATQHFTTLLQRDPNNTTARIHRAKAQYNMGLYVESLQDLSAAIHLDPNDSTAFYLRACLLRVTNPRQALRDYSMSLLLDDSAGNVDAFIHRGVLYTGMKCYDEALADFESASKLNPVLPSPHVCAGLIHMKEKKSRLVQALRCFTAAISVDPTCLRAYLSRAEAYKMDEKYALALMDYTRGIHLDPSKPAHYLYKGEVHLLMKDYDIAHFHIQIAAKLATGFDQSRELRALVESFLGNHQEAIALIQGLPKTPNVYSLLGKIQLKANMFHGATDSFMTALHLLKEESRCCSRASNKTVTFSIPPHQKSGSSTNSETQSEISFLCGQSLVESKSLQEAIDQFSKVLKLTPTNENAYYERGVAKLKAGLGSKGMQDLNRSLALNPTYFQSYLARAAHYGRTGRYTKAVLNCNEAIRLVPTSVRAYLSRGALKYLIRIYPGAIEDLTTAIQLDPAHSSLPLFNRALCYQAIGEDTKAVSDYSEIIQKSENPGIRVLINRGILYLQFKDYANALLDFIEAGKKGSNDASIFQAIGYCYHQLGLLDSSIEAYSEAIALDPAFLEAVVGRGNTYMDYLTENTNNLSKADYLCALQQDPSHLPAHVNLAFLFQAEGRLQVAWDELTSALKHNNRYVPALEARAIVDLQMGDFFGAMLDLTRAIDIKRTATLLTNRGVVHQFMGDIVTAMNDYKAALRLDPTHVLAHFNIGNVLFRQRLFSQAVASYSRAIPHCSSDDDSILVNRAIAYYMLRNTDESLRDFERAIEANPYSAHAHFNRGNLYKSRGDYKNAEEDYKKALEFQPDDWLTLYYYGEVMSKQGKKMEAREAFQRAAEYELP